KKDPSPQESGPSRRSSPTPQYSSLGPVIRPGSPALPSKMVPLLKVNEVKNGLGSLRVGNSFCYLKVGCAMAMILRVRRQVKKSREG
ncbi:hypothetical protein PIB30_074650, partial [Stylosanthes scabra]|nr:hypothetical protein [Stylosanthes scabra]